MPKANTERNARVLAWYRDGRELREITVVFGLTRNAVAGIIHRSGTANRGGIRRPYMDFTGRRFGRLLVLQRVENGSEGGAQHLCECDCGTRTIVRGSNLKNGRTQSCGCLQRDRQFKSKVAA